MERSDSFKNELARMAAEREADQQRLGRRAAYKRMQDYPLGLWIAADLIRRSSGCCSYAEKASALHEGAVWQGNTLNGRVTSSELLKAAREPQAEARWMDAIERMQMAAASRFERSAAVQDRARHQAVMLPERSISQHG